MLLNILVCVKLVDHTQSVLGNLTLSTTLTSTTHSLLSSRQTAMSIVTAQTFSPTKSHTVYLNKMFQEKNNYTVVPYHSNSSTLNTFQVRAFLIKGMPSTVKWEKITQQTHQNLKIPMMIISFFTPEIQKKSCFQTFTNCQSKKSFLTLVFQKKKIFKHVSFQFIKFWNNPLPKSKSFKASICRSLSTPKVIL